MREAQQWAEAQNDELHSVLNYVGASDMMHDLVDVRVDHRRSVVEEIYKWYDGGFEAAVETAQRLGGGFFQKVWGGDVLEAFKHADTNNQRIIAEAYSKDELLGLCDNQTDRNIVDERYPQ